MSDSLRPHELQHASLPCPLPSPGVYSNSSSLRAGQEENGVTEDENSPAITKLYNLILQVGEPQPGEQTDLQKALLPTSSE